MNIGQKIIDAIISGGLLHAECAECANHQCVVVWSSGAAEQIDALVASAQSENGTQTTR